MTICELQLPAESTHYADWVQAVAPYNVWQSLDWKQYQESLGRTVRIYTVTQVDTIVASALVTIDTTSFGFSTWDLPRGPLWHPNYVNEAALLMEHIVQKAKKTRCLAVYASPTVALTVPGFSASPRHVQPVATTIVDIQPPLAEIIESMKPKARYNCRVADKHAISVEHSTDVQPFIDLHALTATRNRFATPQTHMYKKFLETLPTSFLLYAYVPGTKTPIAGLIGLIQKDLGIYYYGASDYAHRATMAPYALQLASMQHCKEHGCSRYDLFGIAPPDATDHPWQGVTRFKQQFGGTTIVYPPEVQCTIRPFTAALLQIKRRLF